MVKPTQPRQLDHPDVAPHRVNAVHDCPAPASSVFAVLADNPGAARWLGWYVTSVATTSTAEHGVGSTRAVSWLYGIGRLEERFIGWEEPSLWSFTLTGARPGLFREFVERIRIEPLGEDSCRVHYDMGVDFTPFGKVLARPLIAWVNQEIGSTLQRLSDAAVAR
ncbi:hypothetical protein HH308_22715 [Gordonia sp. TBRC 11910]|uniref:Polyketide cyclase / dehydrase and lipid transport n=1 Tax=Gordonia asplenii TaxID=2725283 RepID=A0A848L665_9ACTN|nr:SRPBCC family protein [Gordonia asplenii]NMO04031.1 hypothetical protein [Gordonia asplenii]